MMRSNIVTLAILFAILGCATAGEVIESTAAGFLVRKHRRDQRTAGEGVHRATDGVGGWWIRAHLLP